MAAPDRSPFRAVWPALGLALLAGGWALVHATAGPFVLPSLVDTGRALGRVVTSGAAVSALAVTLVHAIGGAGLGTLIGFALGLVGGTARPLGGLLAAPITAILGVPPVAWIVLAFLWFGTGLVAPLFTVTITAFPIVFAATLQGMRARDPGLAEMATVFRLPARTRFFRLLLPELAVHVAPALSTAFAISWKVALTAEVLGDGSGIGGAFATARAPLDLAEAMAWIVLVVVFLLVSDGLVLGPLRRWIAGHREGTAKETSPAPTCVGIGAIREEI
ncbi:MAG: ABC transporter permease subunit [Phyllobacteriaceae bacterium]|nr:ABC transporter permease subunit [Phyllobacteriaceae bacterium]